MRLRLSDVLGNVREEHCVIDALHVHARTWANQQLHNQHESKLWCNTLQCERTSGEEPQWYVRAKALVLLHLAPVDVAASDGALAWQLARCIAHADNQTCKLVAHHPGTWRSISLGGTRVVAPYGDRCKITAHCIVMHAYVDISDSSAL